MLLNLAKRKVFLTELFASTSLHELVKRGKFVTIVYHLLGLTVTAVILLADLYQS
ncbi:hypothetical protein DPMN_164750 [Dreissena polymorpha]|uniref:Uncharacterized protein n=1 Tax=Dreissena polymorpha TaxID=45954 RepID=A0A9D4EWF6_DREPO|nr:hypothetical protein DPMN_164750 [Dreissena polymorpha]